MKMHFEADRAAKTTARRALDVTAGFQSQDRPSLLSRIGARVDLNEARSTNHRSCMVDDVPMDELMTRTTQDM